MTVVVPRLLGWGHSWAAWGRGVRPTVPISLPAVPPNSDMEDGREAVG